MQLRRVAAPAGVGAGTRPCRGSGGFDAEQMKNAAGDHEGRADLKLPVAAQLIGVQAAIGESTLRVIDFGDGAGPDSRGLFQQRANGAWGSYEDRMDPTSVPRTSSRRCSGWRAGKRWSRRSRSTGRSGTRTRTITPSSAPRPRKSSKPWAGKQLPWLIRPGVCPAEGNEVVGDLAGKWVKPMAGCDQDQRLRPAAGPAGHGRGSAGQLPLRHRLRPPRTGRNDRGHHGHENRQDPQPRRHVRHRRDRPDPGREAHHRHVPHGGRLVEGQGRRHRCRRDSAGHRGRDRQRHRPAPAHGVLRRGAPESR